jgi:single-stranded-DNA-specific exonuclease
VNTKYKYLSKGLKNFLKKREVTNQRTFERFFIPTFENLRPADETLKAAVSKVQDFIKKGKKILIWGDEDTDGITATLIMKSLFKEVFGIKVHHYIPDRGKEGYGLSVEGIEKAHKKGIDLIITVDSGTSSVKEVEYLKKKGMDIIITDHHELKEKLPEAPIVNPKLNSFGYKYLSGAGVAFKFSDCMFLDNTGKTTAEWAGEIPEIPAFAFTGTLIDKVPLLDENRIIFIEGLECLRKSEKPPFSFLSLKKNVLKAIIPLASGRERLTWEFFSARTIAEAENIYALLKSKNISWNKSARGEFSSIKNELNMGHLVIFKSNLDYKIASGVANRVKDYCKKPVFIIYSVDSKIRGEGRSPEGFDLLSVLNEVKDLLIDYGGHKCACGFELKKGKIEEFKDKTEVLLKKYKEKKTYDSKLKLSEVTEDLKNLITKMEPFGTGNPPPVFMIDNVNYEKEGNEFFLSNGKIKLKLARVKEMPPPSKKVNAYLEIKGGEITLKRWEWIKE